MCRFLPGVLAWLPLRAGCGSLHRLSPRVLGYSCDLCSRQQLRRALFFSSFHVFLVVRVAFTMLAWPWNFEFAFSKLLSNAFLSNISFSLEKVVIIFFSLRGDKRCHKAGAQARADFIFYCLGMALCPLKVVLWGVWRLQVGFLLLLWGLLHIYIEFF